MVQFDISGVAILKVIGGGVFVYVIAPLLLMLRDLLVLKSIEKWILTNALRNTYFYM